MSKKVHLKEDRSLLQYFTDHEYLLLIISTFLTLVLYPLIVDVPWASVWYHILLSCILLAGMWSSWDHKHLLASTVFLWFLALFFNRADFRVGESKQFILLYLISACVFFCVITARVIWSIVHHDRVNSHVIYGSIAGYLMIGMAGAFIFAIIETLIPGSFNYTVEYIGNVPSFIYYSFVTMSTLWFGDMIPLSSHAQMRSIIMTIAGQIYLTVLIWTLIGKYVRGKR